MVPEVFMKRAVLEAEASLREGDNGFGAVVVKDGAVVASARDTEATAGDPTSHAEMNALRAASQKLGRDLNGCVLVSTHEPCPMCAFAVVWSGIRELAYGYSIREALREGRRRIDFTCAEAFKAAGVQVTIHEGVLHGACAVLYRRDVRAEIEKLRGADDAALDELNQDSIYRRLRWFGEIESSVDVSDGPVMAAYRLLVRRFGVTPEEMPVVRRTDSEVVFHSMNFCPTLEACRILGLDTRHVCRRLNERSTDALVKKIDQRLSFSRNYDKLRPYAACCEEKITLT
jgi:tRNA(adenine34) deaminase